MGTPDPTDETGTDVPTVVDGAACTIPVNRMPLAEPTPELDELIDAGVDPVWVRTLGHAPKAFRAWTDFYWPIIFSGSVSTEIKEAARIRLAVLNECHY